MHVAGDVGKLESHDLTAWGRVREKKRQIIVLMSLIAEEMRGDELGLLSASSNNFL